VFSGLSSIETLIAENTSMFLAEQFPMAKMQMAFAMSASLERRDLFVVLPLLTGIWARITSLDCKLTPISSENFLSSEGVLSAFVKLYDTIVSLNDKWSKDSLRLISSNASATVEMICSLNGQVKTRSAYSGQPSPHTCCYLYRTGC